MPKIDELVNSKQAAGLLKDAGKLEQLRDAPETQRIFSMLSRSTGGDLKGAAERAAQGDAGELAGAIRQVMNSPEGAQLLQKMKQTLK